MTRLTPYLCCRGCALSPAFLDAMAGIWGHGGLGEADHRRDLARRRIVPQSKRSVRATPLLRVKVKITVKISVCCRRRLSRTAF